MTNLRYFKRGPFYFQMFIILNQSYDVNNSCFILNRLVMKVKLFDKAIFAVDIMLRITKLLIIKKTITIIQH